MTALRIYLWNVLLWLDQGANAISFLGDPAETISRRAGRARDRGEDWGCILCGILDWIDPGHCDRSIEDNPSDAGSGSVAQQLSHERQS